MSTHPASRSRPWRPYRRGPVGPMGPALRPVLPGSGRKVAQAPRTVASLMQTVIAAVNARGMCAATAARVAELPADEVEGIAALCACAACSRQRAH